MDVKFRPLIETLHVGKITDKEYFSSKYSKYVSNSRLGNINPEQGGSPEKFFSNMGEIYSDSLVLGSAVHGKILQPGLFTLVKVERPNSKLGFVCDYIYEHAEQSIFSEEILVEASEKIDYYKGKLTKKIIDTVKNAYAPYKRDRDTSIKFPDVENLYLSEKTYNTANSCIDACNQNLEFRKLLHPESLGEVISENELAFTMDVMCDFPDRVPIVLKLKSKLDNFTINRETNEIVVNDLKTIGSILPNFDGREGNFGKYHYHRELAMYLWLLKLYVKEKYGMENPAMRVNCLVVSTIPDYETKVYKVTTGEIKRGFYEFKHLLKLVALNIAYKNYEFK